MRQQAFGMIVGMLAVAVLIAAIGRNPVPLIIIAAVSYMIWQVAKGLDG